MKQVSATYQYEFTEDELRTLCDALYVVIWDSKEVHDSLKSELNNEDLSEEENHDLIKNYYASKNRMQTLVDLYNGLGSPVAKFMSLSL